MEKYLYRLFIALFAITSFSLSSCSEDDDEFPSVGNYRLSLLMVTGMKLLGRGHLQYPLTMKVMV